MVSSSYGFGEIEYRGSRGSLSRGCTGELHRGFTIYMGSCNACIVELCGVLEGLRLPKEFKFRTIELHIDFKVVVQNILDYGHGCIIGCDWFDKFKFKLN